MFEKIIYYNIFGLPLIIIVGIISFLLLIFTALVPYLNSKKILKISFNGHRNLAVITIIFAFLHVIMAFLARI